MKTLSSPLSDPLVRTVERTLSRNRMVQPGDRVLVGFSGGPDSTAALLCLHHLAGKLSITLGAAHLNHDLRGDRAAADARHAADMAARLGIPCVVETRSVSAFRQGRRMSPEEAAREVRYRFLERTAVAGGFTKIALGHHRNDEAESILMRLLRGSGPLGLTGIPPMRDLARSPLAVIRPLIHASRTEIMAFLERRQMAAVFDESNADLRLPRNRIRHRLLPLLLKEFNPALVEGLSRLAELLRDEEDWLGHIARQTLADLTLADHGTLMVLDRRRLVGCHPALQRRMLRAAVAHCQGHLRRLGFASLEAAREFAVRGPRRGSFDLPGGLVMRGRGHRLEVQRLSHRRGQGRSAPPDSPGIAFAYEIPAPGLFPIREVGLTLSFSHSAPQPEALTCQTGQETAFFDMDQLHFPLLVRNFRPGDRMAPLGLEGHQKVKKIFIDRKVAREDRTRYPLLLCGDQILWIVGLRQSEAGKIGPQTRRWLKVEAMACLDPDDGYFKSI